MALLPTLSCFPSSCSLLVFLLLLLVVVNRSSSSSSSTTSTTSTSLPTPTSQIKSIRNVQMQRSVENWGFHRLLVTALQFETDGSGRLDLEDTPSNSNNETCRLMLVEKFTDDVYVDINELKTAMHARSYSFYLSNKVNTETAAFQSLPFELFLYINRNAINCTQKITKTETISKKKHENEDEKDEEELSFSCRAVIRLPIHLRYHAAQLVTVPPLPAKHNNLNKNNQNHNENEQPSYTNFTIKRPKLFYNNCSISTEPEQPEPSKSKSQSQLSSENEEQDGEQSIMELPCSRNLSLNTDYLAYMTNYYKNVKHNNSNNNERKSSLKISKENAANTLLYYLLFETRVCQWIHVPEANKSAQHEFESFIVRVPVGDKNGEAVILMITLISITCLAISVAKSLLEKVRKNTRLGGQNASKYNTSSSENYELEMTAAFSRNEN